ncbi:MAG TPA: hypothetical protein VIX81_13075, partial [Gammaproteobacteria bacterium]
MNMARPSSRTAGFLIPSCMLLAVLLLLHLAVYGSFFLGGAPVGGDYGYFLPILLDQYFWTRTEGLFASPWFTP